MTRTQPSVAATRTSPRRRRVRPLPETMRAAAIDHVGPASVLKIHELPLPKLSAGEVMIAVDTAGVGSWEPDQRSGAWEAPNAHFPLVLGADGSGTVVARGSRVRRFHLGDKVYGYNFGGRKGGFDAEYVAVADRNVARIPPRLDLLHAGASPAVALTALQGIDDALEVKRNERVVVVGASGNVGTFAIQFAKGRGACVLPSRRVALAALARRLGADAAVDGKLGGVRRPSGVRAGWRRCRPRTGRRQGADGVHRCLAERRARRASQQHRSRTAQAPASRSFRMTPAWAREFARLNRAMERSRVGPIAKEFPSSRRRRHIVVEKDICWGGWCCAWPAKVGQ